MVQMGVDSLKSNLTNTQRVYNWELLIPSPVGEGDAETLMIRCQTTIIPGKSFGDIPIPYKGTPGIGVPGKLTMSHILPFTFIEGEDKEVFKALHTWMQKIGHDRLGTGVGDVLIKKDMILTLQTTAGEDTLKIKLIGCYPRAVDDTTLSMADEANVMYAGSFWYDFWEEIS